VSQERALSVRQHSGGSKYHGGRYYSSSNESEVPVMGRNLVTMGASQSQHRASTVGDCHSGEFV